MAMTTGTPSDLYTDTSRMRTALDGAPETGPEQVDGHSGPADAARRAVEQVRETGKAQAQRVKESVQEQPGRWAGIGAGVLALAAAAVGVALWQRNRRRPQHRAARVWKAATRRGFSR
ncbi:hypothetical protein ACQP00_21255 [Dactylosporangium sp. CS-047395]|uniref:hypothetical protein n=1 Tax=Dactylosporangium sp. CS-047395 TaxID=3239936 RepID=UPI003D89E27E